MVVREGGRQFLSGMQSLVGCPVSSGQLYAHAHTYSTKFSGFKREDMELEGKMMKGYY